MNTGNNNEKYYSIGEVSSIVEIKPTVLRFWESEFEELSPIKNKFGHRVYTEKDIETIIKIKNLLYEQGLTIKGAKNMLEDDNVLLNSKAIRKKLYELLDILKKERKNK